MTTQNTGENKVDWFLHRTVDYQVSYNPRTGAVNGTVKVTLRNSAPTTGQSAVVIGTDGQFTKQDGVNSSYLTIYTPWLYQWATVDGRVLPVNSSRELGVWADSAFVSVPPGGTTTIVLRVEGSLPTGTAYRLTMSRQPMVNADQAQVSVTLPPGEGFTCSSGLALSAAGSQATARFELDTNVSFSASVGG
ncbi:MAG: hypothetical protein ACRD0Z_01240 [Acidimicrobiales bacterium]